MRETFIPVYYSHSCDLNLLLFLPVDFRLERSFSHFATIGATFFWAFEPL